ncbi:MAG: response regulator [Proteobacteria bacterium]|nr:response regulator [Pseudomonadota bacterium]
MRVLIANENQKERAALTRLLGGYVDISEAGDSDDLLALFEEGIRSGMPFGIVICDLALGPVDNLDVLTALRHLEENHGIWGQERAKVVALFDAASDRNDYETDVHGCEELLTKPIDSKQLIEVVLRVKASSTDPREYLH